MDTIDRARRYLEKTPPAIDGQGGDEQTFKAALALVAGFDLSPEVAFGVLWDDYNPRCDPPWKEKQLRHKVEQADKAPGRRGNLLGGAGGPRRGRTTAQPPKRDWRASAPPPVVRVGSLPPRVEDWPREWRDLYREKAQAIQDTGPITPEGAAFVAEGWVRLAHHRWTVGHPPPGTPWADLAEADLLRIVPPADAGPDDWKQARAGRAVVLARYLETDNTSAHPGASYRARRTA